jgi:hypothetical protein
MLMVSGLSENVTRYPIAFVECCSIKWPIPFISDRIMLYIPISINFLTNTCKVISFHLQKLLGNSLSCTFNQDLIRKQMLFGIDW